MIRELKVAQQREETEKELFDRLDREYEGTTLKVDSNACVADSCVEEEKAVGDRKDDGDESASSSSSRSSTSSSSTSSDSDSEADCGECRKRKVVDGNVIHLDGKRLKQELVNPGDIVQNYGLLLEFDTVEDCTE